MFIPMIELMMVLAISLFVTFCMKRLARYVDLVDKPNQRKLHAGSIPLVGGLSIGITLIGFLHLNPQSIPYADHFAFSLLVLVTVGALDDRFDISYKIRFAIQALISLSMMHFADVKLYTLGDILGFGDIYLGWFGYVFTVFAVIGTINAFNMVDGIDGLLGGLTIVSFSSIGLLLLADGFPTLAYTCLVMIVIMIPYILFNLGVFGQHRKIFMGDAGSMMIGFMVVWFLVCTSQTKGEPILRPVTALWLIAIPLMDMFSIMFRRIQRGYSPFKPDRDHLHHILQKLGYSSTQTLMIICSLSVLFALFGIFTELAGVAEYVVFSVFLTTLVVYGLMLSYIWQITKVMKKWFRFTHSSSQLAFFSKED